MHKNILRILIAALATQAAAFAEGSDFPGKGDKQEWIKAAKIYNEAVDLFDAGKTDDAIVKFKQAIAIYAYDASFYNELGLALDNKGNLAASEALRRKAIALDPSNWTYWSNLGVVLYKENRLQEAKDAFDRALKLNPPANDKSKIEKTIKIVDQGLNSAALADAASTATFDFPAKGDKQQWVKAVTIYNEGVDLFDAGRTDQAIEKFNQAIAIYPYDPHFYSELGQGLAHKTQFAASEAAFRKAVALDSSNWGYWNNLGIVLYKQNRLQEAKNAFNRALKLNPPGNDKSKIEETIKIIEKLNSPSKATPQPSSSGSNSTAEPN